MALIAGMEQTNINTRNWLKSVLMNFNERVSLRENKLSAPQLLVSIPPTRWRRRRSSSMERFIISRVSRFSGWCAINRLWNDDDDECLASNAIYCLIRQNPLLGHPARFQTSWHFNQSGWRGQMTNAFRSGRNENSGLPCITNRKASSLEEIMVLILDLVAR